MTVVGGNNNISFTSRTWLVIILLQLILYYCSDIITITTTTRTNYVVVAALSSTSTQATPATTTTTARTKNKQCIIVGGGPIGLATALTLANQPHLYNVTVLEKTDGDTAVKKYDASRSYLYNVNPRGLQWFNNDNNKLALNKLIEKGVAPPNDGVPSIVTIPSDPTIPIEQPKNIKLSGTVKLTNRTNFWIPRHQMVELLLECCQNHNNEKDNNNSNNNNNNNQNCGTTINIYQGKQVETVIPTDNDLLSVICQDGTKYTGSLIVAADGIDSTIRQTIANNNNNKDNDTWVQKNRKKSFHIKKYKSPATGLILKALQFPPNFVLINTDGSTYKTYPEIIYAIRSINTGSRNKINIGFLPMKSSTMIRPGNTIVPYDHDIFKLKSGNEIKEFFIQSFPRIPFNNLISNNEWDRYYNAKGTTYPYCQYSPGSTISSNDKLSGIVMVGDACHAFPPDIGQGINAGLQDVVALDQCLRSSSDDDDNELLLGTALENYQNERSKEHRALIRLARFGAPYQYRQPWKRHRIGRMLWTMNVTIRVLLNKITFGITPPPAIVMMANNHNLSFQQIMKRADTMTIIIKAMLACLLLLKFGPRLK